MGKGRQEIPAATPASPAAVSWKIHCAGPVVKETLVLQVITDLTHHSFSVQNMTRPDLATPENISLIEGKELVLNDVLSGLRGPGFPQNLINHHVLLFNRHHDLP